MVTKRDIVLDSEANGLRPDVAHCIVAIDHKTKEEFIFRQEECYKDFPEFCAEEVGSYIGHNLIGFDIPRVFHPLLKMNISLNDVYDTLVMSRLTMCDRGVTDRKYYKHCTPEMKKTLIKKPHSIEGWGIRHQHYKPAFDDWDNFSEEMVHRCLEDTRINVKVFDTLLKEFSGFDIYSLQLEQKVAQIIQEQQDAGIYVDRDKVVKALSILGPLEQKYASSLIDNVPPRKKYKKKSWSSKFKKDGEMVATSKRMLDENEQEINPDGTFNLFFREEFNPKSSIQVREVLDEYGWKPTVFNIPTPKQKAEGRKGGPKTSSLENLATIPSSAPQAIKDIGVYGTICHRLGLFTEYDKLVEESVDGRIRGSVFSLGTPTARMRHQAPNMANVPAVVHSKDDKILYGLEGGFGFECRDVFSVPEGYKMVGCDASGLELRMLAHYMNSTSYTDIILDGDIHSENQRAAGLETRSQAKTFIYAFLYGAGDAKIGAIVGGTAKDGKKLKEKFLNAIPELKALINKIQKEAKHQGWVRGLDGRKIYIRSPHAALNSLLQSAGAIIMKEALIRADFWMKKEKLDARFVNNVHDEFQIESLEDHAIRVGELCVKSIVTAGEKFNMNCPLDAEYKVGNSWAQTH